MMQLSVNILPPPSGDGPWQHNRIGNNLRKLVAVEPINKTIIYRLLLMPRTELSRVQSPRVSFVLIRTDGESNANLYYSFVRSGRPRSCSDRANGGDCFGKISEANTKNNNIKRSNSNNIL